MASREEFLGIVRAALAQAKAARQDVVSTEPATQTDDMLGDVLQRARRAREQAASRRGESLATLEVMSQRHEWNLVHVASPGEAAEAVAGIAARLGVKLAVRSEHGVLEEAGIDAALASTGVEVVAMTHDPEDPEGSRARMRGAASQAGMGITGADYVLAETATAALVSGPGVSRQTGLLPPVHVVVARAEQVIPGMAELLALRLADQQDRGDGRWYMNLISGPSRTADIEQTLVVGVHGPGSVYLVLVGE